MYDDSEKLIDSRFLKKDEVVESGVTLTFEAHLVDIGNLERENHPSANQNASKGDLKLSGKAPAMQQKGRFHYSLRNFDFCLVYYIFFTVTQLYEASAYLLLHKLFI